VQIRDSDNSMRPVSAPGDTDAGLGSDGASIGLTVADTGSGADGK
jgi:hypothetical protein